MPLDMNHMNHIEQIWLTTGNKAHNFAWPLLQLLLGKPIDAEQSPLGTLKRPIRPLKQTGLSHVRCMIESLLVTMFATNGAPGLTTRSKDATNGAPGIATSY